MVRSVETLALGALLASALVVGCGVTPEGTGPLPPATGSSPDVPAQQPMTSSDASVDAGVPPEVGSRPDGSMADGARDVRPVDASADMASPPPPPPGWVGGQLIVGVGQGGRHIVSRDGLTWMDDVQDVRLDADVSKDYQAVAYGAGLVVAVGGGCVGTTCTGRITTFDGSTWSVAPIPVKQALTGVAYGQGTWVAVGGGGACLYSADGKHWNAAKTTLPVNLWAVAWGPVGDTSMFVTVGDDSLRARSLDGQTWTDAKRGFPNEDNPIVLHTVAIGDKVAVAGGEGGRRIRTVDGLTWDGGALGGADVPALVYADHMFFGYATDGNAWVTMNSGVSWTPITIIEGPRRTTTAGVMRGTRLYVGSTGGAIKSSADGRGWTLRRIAATDDNAFTAFTFAGY
jgi:hypothetical protein